jgi:hypothetical protein
MDPNFDCVHSALSIARDINSNFSCTDRKTDIHGISPNTSGGDSSYNDDRLGKLWVVNIYFHNTCEVIIEYFTRTIKSVFLLIYFCNIKEKKNQN